MSFLSDPEHLEHLAQYLLEKPPNVTLREVADALIDAAERIRGLQDEVTRRRTEQEVCTECRTFAALRAALGDEDVS
jgi:hypothetical protein